MIGTTVGKYRILDRLGRGGMGIVYKGLDETLHREVAIKVLNPDITDAELLKRFRSEAISLARLNHPGIATIYELHQRGDDMLMVMEFVRGETLQALSERVGPLEPPQVAHICVQILNALAHAHRSGIIHRDLKPANVMITDGGMVKIMDFGIARMLGGEQLTHAGSMMGTPAYMAPEQVLGGEIDGRADLYAVGVLFYRLLSRELPFKADTAIAMAQKQVADDPTPIRSFRPNIPAWCEALIIKALAKAPADRYQSAEAFRAAILTAVTPGSLDELPTMATAAPMGLGGDSDMTVGTAANTADAPTMTRAVPNTGISRPPAVVAPAPTPGSGTPAVERTGTTVVLGRGHLMGLAAVLVVLIGGLAALGYAAFRRNADPPPAPVATEQTAEMSAPADPAASAEPATVVEEPTTPPPDVPVPPPAPVPPSAPPRDASQASGTAGRAARERASTVKPEPAPAEAPAAAEPPAPIREPLAPAEASPVKAPVTFDNVKMLVPQGNGMRESDAVLTLTGSELSLTAKEDNRMASVPFTSISQAFYSRSKEPRWKGADGKQQSVNVDLGRMSFFRGERNWLILVTGSQPVFVRFEDSQMQTAFNSFQERTGIKIQR